ncbi:hypothetical protein ACS3QZ_18295 [Shimia sp. W99]
MEPSDAKKLPALEAENAKQKKLLAEPEFDNAKRKHTSNGMPSPVDFELRQQKLNQAGVQETWGSSAKTDVKLGIFAS